MFTFILEPLKKEILHVGKFPHLVGQNEVLGACIRGQVANEFKWTLHFLDENFGTISSFLWKYFYIA